MKKWLFLFMAFLIFIVVSGCNSNLSSTALIETANQTTITTTIEDQTTTTQTTSGGTISETTLYLVEFDSGGAGVVPSQGIYALSLHFELSVIMKPMYVAVKNNVHILS
jgi:ABC-type Fe3+-hydroxamate transport system substrate-binding protein